MEMRGVGADLHKKQVFKSFEFEKKKKKKKKKKQQEKKNKKKTEKKTLKM